MLNKHLFCPSACQFIHLFIFIFLQNRGVYMFRIDSEHVIDATITGGPARWKINLNF